MVAPTPPSWLLQSPTKDWFPVEWSVSLRIPRDDRPCVWPCKPESNTSEEKKPPLTSVPPRLYWPTFRPCTRSIMGRRGSTRLPPRLTPWLKYSKPGYRSWAIRSTMRLYSILSRWTPTRAPIRLSNNFWTTELMRENWTKSTCAFHLTKPIRWKTLRKFLRRSRGARLQSLKLKTWHNRYAK